MLSTKADREFRTSRERWRRRLVSTPIVLVAALVIGVFAYARLAWNAWPWQYSPSEISACGRGYQRGDLESKAKLAADQEHLVRHGDVGLWFHQRPLWAEDASAGQPVTVTPDGCSTVMWIQESDDSYRSYAIEGSL